MTKRFFALTLSLMLVFSSFGVFAEGTEVDELAIEELEVELEDVLEDMDEVLEVLKEVDEIIEEQEDLVDVQNFSSQSYTTKALEPEGLIKKQIRLKKEFVNNTVQVSHLTKDVKNNILEANRELRIIIKSVDRNMSKADYVEIAKLVKELKSEIEEIDYVVGSIRTESKIYINNVFSKKYARAMKSFERIVSLQEDQIALLNVIEINTSGIKSILKNV